MAFLRHIFFPGEWNTDVMAGGGLAILDRKVESINSMAEQQDAKKQSS